MIGGGRDEEELESYGWETGVPCISVTAAIHYTTHYTTHHTSDKLSRITFTSARRPEPQYYPFKRGIMGQERQHSDRHVAFRVP